MSRGPPVTRERDVGLELRREARPGEAGLSVTRTNVTIGSEMEEQGAGGNGGGQAKRSF